MSGRPITRAFTAQFLVIPVLVISGAILGQFLVCEMNNASV
jgi:hypothetical protein